LGRPIVQEFSAPSVELVTILVDTSSGDATLERLLSLAATAVNELCRRRVRTRLFVTSEPVETFAAARNVAAVTESEPMLIQLASAKPTIAPASNERLIEVLEQLGRSPVLLLSGRSKLPPSLEAYANVTPILVPATSAIATAVARADVSSRRIDAGHQWLRGANDDSPGKRKVVGKGASS
jgi:hypothetical protein